MSFLLDTHSEPLLKVLHHMLQHFLQHSCDFLTNGKFQLFGRAWSVRVHSTLEVPHKKKLQIDRSGEHGGQETLQKWEITCWGNMYWTTSIDTLAMWALAPSCSNHISLMFTHAFGVLDAGSCLACRHSAPKSLKLQSPPLQKSKDQWSLPSKHHTTLSLLSCGEVFGVVYGVTFELWRGLWCSFHGFSAAQNRQFSLFTNPFRWKWALLLIITTALASSVRMACSHKSLCIVQNPLRPAAGQSLFCMDEILTCCVRCDTANNTTYPKLMPDTQQNVWD